VKVAFRASFLRDLENVTDKTFLERVKQTIEEVEQAPVLTQVRNLKKLRGPRNYYRIRLGDYRFGLLLEADALVFVRFLHRKDVYRYFP
jgi:mRNA interferase RelE/StbE